jgi:hypothetical protein
MCQRIQVSTKSVCEKVFLYILLNMPFYLYKGSALIVIQLLENIVTFMTKSNVEKQNLDIKSTFTPSNTRDHKRISNANFQIFNTALQN